jgi:hypothetical protein
MRNWPSPLSRKIFEIGVPAHSDLILWCRVSKRYNNFYCLRKDLCVDKKMSKGMRSKCHHPLPLRKVKVVDGRMGVIAQRAYDRKISNLILHPSTVFISPLMPN